MIRILQIPLVLVQAIFFFPKGFNCDTLDLPQFLFSSTLDWLESHFDQNNQEL